MPKKTKTWADRNGQDNVGLKLKFNKEIEALKRTQVEMKMEFKNLISQLMNWWMYEYVEWIKMKI